MCARLTAPVHLVRHLAPQALDARVVAGHRHVVARVQQPPLAHQPDHLAVVGLARVHHAAHLLDAGRRRGVLRRARRARRHHPRSGAATHVSPRRGRGADTRARMPADTRAQREASTQTPSRSHPPTDTRASKGADARTAGGAALL